jgi:hypothetical protein
MLPIYNNLAFTIKRIDKLFNKSFQKFKAITHNDTFILYFKTS